MSQRSKHIYEFAPFRLDARERLLLRDGAAVPLPPKAFDLLLALIEHHGHLLEKDELLKAVWPDTFVEEVNLSYNVSLIRKALGEGENGHLAGKNPGPAVVSPNGCNLAFVASTPDGKTLIWVRPLNTLTAQPLAGTEGASSPFWSPDDQWLGFFVGKMLKKIKISGGTAHKLCDLNSPGQTGTWSRDGVIIFATTTSHDPLYQVSASGGAPSAVTELEKSPREVNQQFPYFLPDGRHFLYLSRRGQGAEREWGGIYVASLDNQERKLLLTDFSNIAYGSGYLLFGRGRALMAQSFDAERHELIGEAFLIADHVRFTNQARAVFSISENGVLIYQTDTAGAGSQLVWFDRDGKQLGALGDPAYYRDADLSPDGKKAAVDIRDTRLNRQDIWLYDIARGIKTRFTLDSVPGAVPLWSPDRSRIIYCSNRKGPFDLYQRAANGAGVEEMLLESTLTKFPTGWSRDGRFVLYFTYGDPKTKADIWVLPMFGERKPFPFLQTEAMELHGEFSPDGGWIAYVSDESRQSEVYVTPFPGPGGKHQVSIAGGRFPRWRGDGKELFYLAADNKLMAAEVNIKGSALEIGAVRPLFETLPAQQGRDFDVTADGQRFLVNTLGKDKESLPITLVVNWTADLKR